jgi:hypothetical protein
MAHRENQWPSRTFGRRRHDGREFLLFFILTISNVAPNWWILPFLLLIPFAGLSLSYFFWKIFVGMRRWMPIHLTNIFSPLPFSGKDKRRHELYCSFLFCYLTIFRGWRLCDIILASLFRPLFHIYYTVFYSETIAALCVCVCVGVSNDDNPHPVCAPAPTPCKAQMFPTHTAVCGLCGVWIIDW